MGLVLEDPCTAMVAAHAVAASVAGVAVAVLGLSAGDGTEEAQEKQKRKRTVIDDRNQKWFLRWHEHMVP